MQDQSDVLLYSVLLYFWNRYPDIQATVGNGTKVKKG